MIYKRVLLALDLEGVNNVVGEPYNGLARGTEQWGIAREQAVIEVNAAAEALFEAGAEAVGLWDNHGGGNNVDTDAVDPRIVLIPHDNAQPRMQFADGKYDCICFFGYHAMEGTLGGVLAHTMSSKAVQHYKLNGKHIGELDIDVYIAASMGIPSRFFAGGDIACGQAKRTVSEILTVATKKELSRNKAIFRDNGELLADIKRTVVEAVNIESEAHTLSFPVTFEKSYKRVEDAEKYLTKLRSIGICADYLDDDVLQKDAHTVVSTIYDIGELVKAL